jgi:Domain of Unknown Function (DUF928)
MTSLKSTLYHISACLSLSAALAFYSGSHIKAVGQSIEPPPGQGSPSGTAGGGSRTSTTLCVRSPKPTGRLMALSPKGQIALTSIDRPDLWIYLPKTTAQMLELSVFDAEMNGIYQTLLPIQGEAGLMSLRLPKEAPKLKPNQPYYWTVALVCNQNDRTADWVVGGWIKRIELDPSAKEKLASAAAGDRVSLYVAHGLWDEALSLLIELRQTQPHDSYLTTLWADLLRSLGLGTLATEVIASQHK